MTIGEITNNLIQVVLAFVSGVGVTLFKIWIEKKPRVIAYYTSIGFFTIKNKETDFQTVVSTHVLIVRNQGKKPARNITINHSRFDSKICILPQLDYSLKDTAQGVKLSFCLCYL